MVSLPRTLLVEIGRLATTWAEIEQYLILHVSAMTAQDHKGVPTGEIQTGFKRLRTAWKEQLRLRFGNDLTDKRFNPINLLLVEGSKTRGTIFHGVWTVLGRGQYELSYWEQKETLKRVSYRVSLNDLRRINAGLNELLRDLEAGP